MFASSYWVSLSFTAQACERRRWHPSSLLHVCCFWQKLPTHTHAQKESGRKKGKEREKRKVKSPSLASVHSLWKLSPARFLYKKKPQAGTCIGFLLTRIVNVPWIKKQSLVQYDTSPLSFIRGCASLVLQKPRIELSTWGTIKVVRQQPLQADFCWGELLDITLLSLSFTFTHALYHSQAPPLHFFFF